jgi:hypothetical protein
MGNLVGNDISQLFISTAVVNTECEGNFRQWITIKLNSHTHLLTGTLVHTYVRVHIGTYILHTLLYSPIHRPVDL